jgi:mannosyltransferase OCH1-like enzyme
VVVFCCISRYGGIYLDSDIIVLKSLSSLSNCVGKEDRLAGGSLNGAVMAFKRNR